MIRWGYVLWNTKNNILSWLVHIIRLFIFLLRSFFAKVYTVLVIFLPYKCHTSTKQWQYLLWFICSLGLAIHGGGGGGMKTPSLLALFQVRSSDTWCAHRSLWLSLPCGIPSGAPPAHSGGSTDGSNIIWFLWRLLVGIGNIFSQYQWHTSYLTL